MTTGAFIIARLSSSRLPQKNIKKIVEKPMIQLLADRIRNAKNIDKIIIATSALESDNPLEELAEQIGIACYRGPLDNIMERICGAAEQYDCDTIVELLGDNPLIHSELIDDTVALYRQGVFDYAATLTKEYTDCEPDSSLFSLGLRVQVYSKKAADLFVNYPDLISDEDRHPTAYMFENPDQFNIGFLEAKEKWGFMNRPELNFAVNYKKNFDFVRTIFELLYEHDDNFSLKDIYRCLDQNRHLYLMMGE